MVSRSGSGRCLIAASAALLVMAAALAGCGDSAAEVPATTTTTVPIVAPTTEAPTTTVAPATTEPAVTTEAPTTTVAPTTTTIAASTLVGGDLPVSGGFTDPDLAEAVQGLADFMAEHGVDAGVLAVSRLGVPVASVGIGWLDEEHTRTVPPDTPMRIASVTKPIVLSAFRMGAGELGVGWTDAVFCTPGGPQPCWLDLEPTGGEFAGGIGQVMTMHLAYHQGGWDRYASFDPMFASIAIADELGLDRPPEAEEVAAYMASQPLDFTPGMGEEYSNFGYLLLGLVIEEASGMDLLDYLQATVFEVSGDHDVSLGRTLPEDRDPREPYYYCSGQAPSVFDPGTRVCWPDGGWYLEPMEAHGGLVATAPAVVAFLDHFCIDGEQHDPDESCGNWAFFGSLDGTLSLARQLEDGTNVMVILNRRHGIVEDDLMAVVDRFGG